MQTSIDTSYMMRGKERERERKRSNSDRDSITHNLQVEQVEHVVIHGFSHQSLLFKTA